MQRYAFTLTVLIVDFIRWQELNLHNLSASTHYRVV